MPDHTRSIRKEIRLNEQELYHVRSDMSRRF